MAGASTVVKPTRMVNKCPQGLDSPPGNNYKPNYTTVRDLRYAGGNIVTAAKHMAL